MKNLLIKILKNYFITLILLFVIMCVCSYIGHEYQIHSLEVTSYILGLLWVLVCLLPPLWHLFQ